jgi:hypothetical protein
MKVPKNIYSPHLGQKNASKGYDFQQKKRYNGQNSPYEKLHYPASASNGRHPPQGPIQRCR